MPKVMIHPAGYEKLSEAVDLAFELFPLELRSKRILIKPNVLRASRPEEGIVTYPTVLRAVVEEVETMGPASIVVGDNPGVMGYGANEECFRRTGLMGQPRAIIRILGTIRRRLISILISWPKSVSLALCWNPISSSACQNSKRTV